MDLEEIDRTKWLRILKILGGQQLREKIDLISDEEIDYASCRSKLKEYFAEQRSINAVRHEFFNIKQRKDETTKQYIEKCKKIGKDCEFNNFDLKDALILNLCENTPHEKLRNEILVKELTLEQAIKYGTSMEMAIKESRIMTKNGHNEPVPEVQAVKKAGPYSRQAKLREASKECGRCGRPEPHTCRAIRAKCHICTKVGHFANKCRNKKVHRIQEEEESRYAESSEDDQEEY